MIRLAVVGGRDFEDVDMLTRNLDHLIMLHNPDEADITIVSGGAKGADTLAREYATKRSYGYKEYPAEWDKYGKSAGFRRNKQIVAGCDCLIAFWDGDSKGTKLSIELAKHHEKSLYIVYY